MFEDDLHPHQDIPLTINNKGPKLQQNTVNIESKLLVGCRETSLFLVNSLLPKIVARLRFVAKSACGRPLLARLRWTQLCQVLLSAARPNCLQV